MRTVRDLYYTVKTDFETGVTHRELQARLYDNGKEIIEGIRFSPVFLKEHYIDDKNIELVVGIIKNLIGNADSSALICFKDVEPKDETN